ncbi:hypothetical protein L208DRAFT_1288755 [Tricholoma matsutake]|nr:hypothetical protein L208DRAFT_1288755 [Tricholoma matsutake 945]
MCVLSSTQEQRTNHGPNTQLQDYNEPENRTPNTPAIVNPPPSQTQTSDHAMTSATPDKDDPAATNPHLQTNQHREEPTTPQASSLPFTSTIFPRTVIPYHAITGNINSKTTTAIESNPDAFLAIIPYSGGKQLLEENPTITKDIEHFIRSLGYQNSETTRVTAPRAKYPPTDDFGKPHTLLLTNAPRELITYLLYQQTFAFKTSKEGGQKKIAFHALPFDKSMQSWIITNISGSYVANNHYARMNALATIKTVLSHDPDFRNTVDRCYAQISSPLDLDGRVEDALSSFHLTTITLSQQGADDREVWQLMARLISSNNNNHNKWTQSIRNAFYLVDHIFPLNTFRIIRQCDFCKNETHPQYMCPFPLVEGWKGPIPDKVLQAHESKDTR